MSLPSVRRTAIAACTALLVLGLAACGSSSTDSSSKVSGPATADQLTIAIPTDVGPIDLFAGRASDQLVELVYDKLFAPSPYVDEVQPWLATAAREIDPSTWEVDLRTDVKWQDGEPFTPEDVIFSVDYMHKVPTGRYTHHTNDTPNIKDVVKVDSDTVRFDCNGYCPSLAEVTLADLPIVAEHVWSKIDPAQAKTVQTLPIGTGPYKLTSYSPTEGYTFTANEDYFAGKPTVKTIKMPIITDQSATFTALQSGEIDATTRALPPELVDQFDSNKSLNTIKTTALNFPEIKMNFNRAPLDNGDFRLALSDALDKQQMLDVVALGQGKPALKGYPHPSAPFANPDNSTPTDPKTSKSLLDKLGYTDTNGDGVREINGKPIELTLYVDSGLPQYVSAAKLAAEDFLKVGIKVNIEGYDAATLTQKSADRTYDLLIGSIGAHGVADPDQFIQSHHANYLWAAGKPWPAWDALYAEWLQQKNHDDQVKVEKELQTVHNNAPTTIPLFYPDEHFSVSKKFGGWVETPGYGIVTKWSFLPSGVVKKAHSNTPGAVTVEKS